MLLLPLPSKLGSNPVEFQMSLQETQIFFLKDFIYLREREHKQEEGQREREKQTPR